jgi:hypothetical protein
MSLAFASVNCLPYATWKLKNFKKRMLYDYDGNAG